MVLISLIYYPDIQADPGLHVPLCSSTCKNEIHRQNMRLINCSRGLFPVNTEVCHAGSLAGCTDFNAQFSHVWVLLVYKEMSVHSDAQRPSKSTHEKN